MAHDRKGFGVTVGENWRRDGPTRELSSPQSSYVKVRLFVELCSSQSAIKTPRLCPTTSTNKSVFLGEYSPTAIRARFIYQKYCKK